METVRCSGCQRVFDDETTLMVHQEYEYCMPSDSNRLVNEYLCPICEQVFHDTSVLQIHVNEEHLSNSAESAALVSSDSLYAQDLERRDKMKQQYERENQTTSIVTDDEVVEDEDMMIARLLQDEENARSFKEFQNRYGGSAKSVQERAKTNLENLYTKKLISREKYLEYQRDLEVIIKQPIERRESRMSDLIPIIAKLPMGPLMDRRLCRPGCDHIGATWLDQGWACGYKNFQMLLSSLRHDPQFAEHLFGNAEMSREIPSVHHLQNAIEKAWAAGFDSEGRDHFNGSLVESTRWIGPTEVMACLSNLNIKTELYDFYQPKNINKNVAYAYMFDWIRKYFQQNSADVIHPLYLQHEGHSRTIIGYEQFKNGNIRLLIFDPSTSKREIENFTHNPNVKVHLFRRTLQSFQKPVYQILVVRGLFEGNEREASKRIRSIKVPLPTN